jgi:hypothetical protein
MIEQGKQIPPEETQLKRRERRNRGKKDSSPAISIQDILTENNQKQQQRYDTQGAQGKTEPQAIRRRQMRRQHPSGK